MQKTSWTIVAAALLSSSLMFAGARQDASSLGGRVMDAAGMGLPATTVWIAPNLLTQAEMSQIDAAQKALESAKLRLEAEQTKLDMGRSIVRFVMKEQQDVLQAEALRTALEVTALGKVFPAAIRNQQTVTTDAAGGFAVQGLLPGSYVIKAFRGGFEPSTLTVVEVKSGQTATADITIRRF